MEFSKMMNLIENRNGPQVPQVALQQPQVESQPGTLDAFIQELQELSKAGYGNSKVVGLYVEYSEHEELDSRSGERDNYTNTNASWVLADRLVELKNGMVHIGEFYSHDSTADYSLQ